MPLNKTGNKQRNCENKHEIDWREKKTHTQAKITVVVAINIIVFRTVVSFYFVVFFSAPLLLFCAMYYFMVYIFVRMQQYCSGTGKKREKPIFFIVNSKNGAFDAKKMKEDEKRVV